MKVNEKTEKKDTAALIIRKYQQYLKLEKSLSKNTLDAYMTDLDKLLNFLQSENIEISDVCLDDLERFSAGLHDIGIHPRSQARIISGIKSFFHFLIMPDIFFLQISSRIIHFHRKLHNLVDLCQSPDAF